MVQFTDGPDEYQCFESQSVLKVWTDERPWPRDQCLHRKSVRGVPTDHKPSHPGFQAQPQSSGNDGTLANISITVWHSLNSARIGCNGCEVTIGKPGMLKLGLGIDPSGRLCTASTAKPSPKDSSQPSHAGRCLMPGPYQSS